MTFRLEFVLSRGFKSPKVKGYMEIPFQNKAERSSLILPLEYTNSGHHTWVRILGGEPMGEGGGSEPSKQLIGDQDNFLAKPEF